MAIFNSYVKLPEGTLYRSSGSNLWSPSRTCDVRITVDLSDLRPYLIYSLACAALMLALLAGVPRDAIDGTVNIQKL